MDSTQVIVGLHGKMRSGKSTAAEELNGRGFARVPFSKPLKSEVLQRLHRTLRAYVKEKYGDVAEGGIDRVIKDLIYVNRDEFTRSLLQEYGTEVRRRDDPHYWTRAWLNSIRGFDRVVVEDVRFENEAQVIWDLGGVVIEIVRPVNPEAQINPDHASEQPLPRWRIDATVVNDGTRDDLHRKIIRQLETLWPSMHF